jgi:tetratricopeptide (TPR) repeat protein
MKRVKFLFMPNKIISSITVLILTGILFYIWVSRLASFYHNRGIEAYDNQRYEESADFFKKSLSIMPNMSTYDYMAHTYEKLQKTEKAALIYNKIISKKPFDPDAYLSLAKIYLKNRMFEEAISLLKNARKMIPEDKGILKLLDTAYLDYANNAINKSLILYLTGRKFEAYSLVHNALKLDPSFAYAHYLLAYYYYTDNDPEQAMRKIKDVLKINPSYWQAYKLSGDIFFKRKEYFEAISAYKQILRFNHYDYVVYNDIGVALVNVELYGQAIVYLKEALRLSPDNLDIIFNLASAYRDAGLFDHAISKYNKLYGHDPGYPNMHNNLAEIYIAQGRQDLALDVYHREIKYTQQRLEHNPDNISELNNLARAYNGVGYYQRAKAIINKVIGMAPDYRDAYITLAKIEEKQNNFDDALKAFYAAKSLTAYSGFIDKYIADIKDKASTSFSPADIVKTKKTFIPSHKILFENGRSIEGIMLSISEEEIILLVPAGDSELKVSLRTDDIDRIETHKQKVK